MILLTVRWYLRYNLGFRDSVEMMEERGKMPLGIPIRQIKYLNHIVEQDHRFMKRRKYFMLGLNSFRTATCILAGVEAMHMRKKEQIDFRDQSVQTQKQFIHQLFGLTA
ncbi:DDE-type integrase/transposase/recombinase [Bacillus cereus]|uniref:DDE-type integrase/transposase/recombinase n=1 Tax=Bacillus cereus TaxID=1396 RepID=UPI0020D28391|nr:DDE-type integrase/transposase/recombinase [Bacillus cereus]